MEMGDPFGPVCSYPVDLGCIVGVGGEALPYRWWLKSNKLKHSLDNYNKWLESEKKARIKKYGKKIYDKTKNIHKGCGTRKVRSACSR